jgi:hypothetical protein
MFSSFNIPEDVAESLAAVGSFGLAKSTWSTYRTSEKAAAALSEGHKDQHGASSIAKPNTDLHGLVD